MVETNLTVLLRGKTARDQLGYHRAFENLVDQGAASGYRAFPYGAPRTVSEWDRLWGEVTAHMATSGSNVLFLQHFHGASLPDPRPHLAKIRSLAQRPVIATSCGDPYGRWDRPPRSLTRAASESDVTFTSSMGSLANILEAHGARRVTLMPLSACDVRFGATPPPPRDRDFDVVFVGSRVGGRNFTRGQFWYGRRRQRYVERLVRRYGARFGLFGHGWEGLRSWNGPAAFDDQARVCQRARVVFGGYPGSLCHYYASNRPFIQMLSGVPMVDQNVIGVDRLLRDGQDWVLVEDIDQAIATIDGILDGRLDGCSIGADGAEAVRARHLNSHRAALMLQIFEELLAARRDNRVATCPPLTFFHDDEGALSGTDARRRW